MRPIGRLFCEKRGISYHEASLFRALASVGNHLGEMTAAYVATTVAEAVTVTVTEDA
jgi:hypothetical protein